MHTYVLVYKNCINVTLQAISSHGIDSFVLSTCLVKNVLALRNVAYILPQVRQEVWGWGVLGLVFHAVACTAKAKITIN